MLRTAPLLVLALLAIAVPAASAAPPPPDVRTFTLCAPFAYIDAPAPGRVFTGTIFKGEQFRVDRSARVASGPAKGLWRHGTRTARDDRSRPQPTAPPGGSGPPRSAATHARGRRRTSHQLGLCDHTTDVRHRDARQEAAPGR